MPRPKYPLKRMSREHHAKFNGLPSFGPNGNLTGMRENYGWQDAMPVKCGAYVYNCISKPALYYNAK